TEPKTAESTPTKSSPRATGPEAPRRRSPASSCRSFTNDATGLTIVRNQPVPPTLMIGQLSTTLPGRSVRPLVFSSLLIWLSLVISTGFEPAFQVRIVSAHSGE